MKRVAFVFGALGAVLIANQASAFDQGAAQAACGNDVFALCQQAIPDHTRIAACLRANERHVSQPCRQFMANSAAEMRRTAQHKGGTAETVGRAASD